MNVRADAILGSNQGQCKRWERDCKDKRCVKRNARQTVEGKDAENVEKDNGRQVEDLQQAWWPVHVQVQVHDKETEQHSKYATKKETNTRYG